MPPGTGDVQLTLSQTANISGSVIVTTPHPLSLIDTLKGITMFNTLNIPVLSVVENMAYFKCDHGQLYYPFGSSGGQYIIEKLESLLKPTVVNVASDSFAVEYLRSCPLFSLPISMESAAIVSQKKADQTSSRLNMDAPVVISKPDSETAKTYHQLADSIIGRIFLLETEAIIAPTVTFDAATGLMKLRYLSDSSAYDLTFPAIELRRRSSISGEVAAAPAHNLKASEPPKVSHIEIKGKYGVRPVWSDGYKADIFPYDVLQIIAKSVSGAK